MVNYQNFGNEDEKFKYDKGQAWYDYAILVLMRPLIYSAKVSPICLPTPGSSYTDRMITLTGWGATNQKGGPSPDLLQETKLKVLSDQQCEKRKGSSIYNSRYDRTVSNPSFSIFYLVSSFVHLRVDQPEHAGGTLEAQLF